MATRLFGFRQPPEDREETASLAPDVEPAPPVEVVGSKLDSESELSISDTVYDSGDPYNNTGRFLAEKIRDGRDD